jgi:hypothetical protein
MALASSMITVCTACGMNFFLHTGGPPLRLKIPNERRKAFMGMKKGVFDINRAAR